MKEKLSKDEFWNSMDPDKLNLTKKDLLEFCNKVLDEWSENKVANIKYIIAIKIMIAQIRLTPEPILKAIWKKITLWFYDLTYQNALQDTQHDMFRELKKIGRK
tara:strand:- start:338 stop:649 length:312 start_codon:yes stop_codon:yes gene_type:complete